MNLYKIKNLIILTYNEFKLKGLDWVSAMKAKHKLKNDPFVTGKTGLFIIQLKV